MTQPKRYRLHTAGICLGALAALPAIGLGQTAGEAPRLQKLEQENSALRQRLDALEDVARKEGILPSGADAPKMVSAMSDISLSGFVTASYFYNSRSPADRMSDGYLWNTSHNAFSLNKVKLTLASKPVERSGDSWDAAFRASMIWGEDAPVVNTGGGYQGFEDLREAFVEFNAPIGTGLNIKVGQLISLLNFESGDGGAANPNFSQGYQWFFTGNGPSSGVQLGYTLTDWLDVKVRVQNGMYAGPFDGNNGKTAIGSIGIKPSEKSWISLIGFGGDESSTMSVAGGSVLAGADFSDRFHAGLEVDYFNFDPAVGAAGDLWSVGGWLWYDLDPKATLALRGEYLKDEDGMGLIGIGLPGRAGSGIFSTDANGDITSFALTLTYKPLPSVRIQPEIRYDHTSYAGGFDGRTSRLVFGAGVSYLF